MKRLLAAILAALTAVSLSACMKAGDGGTVDEIPVTTAATRDEAVIAVSEGAVEDSLNVNGKRFNITLYDFTAKYNAEKKKRGDTDLLIMSEWRKNGQDTKDSKGVRIQYYYYDDEGMSITVTVETESEKLVNVGCGTTNKKFTDEDTRLRILMNASLMAQIVCGYDSGMMITLQDIFRQTSNGSDKSLYYDGFVFTLATKENVGESKEELMHFRVFPISQELRTEWKLKEYQKREA